MKHEKWKSDIEIFQDLPFLVAVHLLALVGCRPTTLSNNIAILCNGEKIRINSQLHEIIITLFVDKRQLWVHQKQRRVQVNLLAGATFNSKQRVSKASKLVGQRPTMTKPLLDQLTNNGF